MKNKRFGKAAAVCALVLCCSVLPASCSSEEAPSVQVLVGSPYVDSGTFETVAQELTDSHPQWQEQEAPVVFTSMSFGDPEKDPYAGANLAKVSAMVAAKEVDLIVCDTENAARFARGDMFVPVQDVLSEEALAGNADRLLRFERVDDQGNPTGEYTQECGIAVEGNEQLDAVYGDQEYGVFLVSNADPMESAEKVFSDLAGVE